MAGAVFGMRNVITLDQVLKAFQVIPDYDLSIMKEHQTLFDITVSILEKIKRVLDDVKPDLVLVHGDTSTTFITSLACYYSQIPVGHVEAGLRTYDIYSPFPEEFNRQAVGIIAALNFAPTETARENRPSCTGFPEMFPQKFQIRRLTKRGSRRII